MCQKLDIYARKLHPVNFLLKALARNLSKNFYLREKARFCLSSLLYNFLIFLESYAIFTHAVLLFYMRVFLSNFNKATCMNIIRSYCWLTTNDSFPSTTIVFSRLLTSRRNSTCIFNHRLATFFP